MPTIRFLDRATDPAEHLAIDEAILVTNPDRGGDAIRFWEFSDPTVILGRSSRFRDEIDEAYRDRVEIPVLRRCSGGASVVGGPGCLMYTMVFDLRDHPKLRRIDAAHDEVMGRLLGGVRRQLPEAERQGICDLTWKNRKFSGNSLRIARDTLMYHGTILYSFDLKVVGRVLTHAPRQPDYRGGRDHQSFVTNAPLDASRLVDDLAKDLNVYRTRNVDELAATVERLLNDRYRLADWHRRH